MTVPYPFLFGISGGEVLILLLLVLLLFGPKKIPEIARMIGRGMNEVKKVQREINTEIHRYSSDIEREAKEMESEIKQLADEPASGTQSVQNKNKIKDKDEDAPADVSSGDNPGSMQKQGTGHADVNMEINSDDRLDDRHDNDLPYPYGSDRNE